MSKKTNKKTVIRIPVIVLLIIAVACFKIIDIATVKTEISKVLGIDKHFYADTEATGTEYLIKSEETWDVSKNGDGSVVAKWTLKDRTLRISGSGDMKDWTQSSKEDWHETKYTKIIENVIIERGVTSTGNHAFYDCSGLTSITIQEGVTNIGSYAFSRCSSLKSITIPNSATSIGKFAFEGCSSLTKIEVENNNTKYISIDGVLYNKEQTKIIKYPANKKGKRYNILNSVTGIGRYAFSDCSSLTSITIPDGVTSIGWNAFYGCNSLTSIAIPSGVADIGKDAFSYIGGYIACEENSVAHKYAEENKIGYLFTHKLTINPNGGKYNNKIENSTLQEIIGTILNLEAPIPPTGYEIIFDTNGGSIVNKITSTKEFDKWELSEEAKGSLNGTTYTFGEGNDTITAKYKDIAITLPSTTKEGYTFAGWYTDSTLTTKAGEAKASYTPTGNITLYAKWEKIEEVFTSEKYKIEEDKKTIGNVEVATTVTEFKKKITSTKEYKITDKNGKDIEENKYVGTGSILKLDNKEYKIVVQGDLNGTGNLELSDLAQAQKVFLELIKNDELKSKALDINQNGKVDLNDLAKLQRMHLGKE